MIAETTDTVSKPTAQAPQRQRPQNSYLIRKVAVLGAGNMGSRIAAHLANAGLPVVLLDIVPPDDPADRNQIAKSALEALKKAKPTAFFDASAARLITTGNFEDHLELLRDCDWIIEAVSENLEIKRALLHTVSRHLRADAIVTSNTSGLPVAQIAEGMDAGFRRHWFGTHFFNPRVICGCWKLSPRRMPIPPPSRAVEHFVGKRLGKTVVVTRKTRRIGTLATASGAFALMNAIRVSASHGHDHRRSGCADRCNARLA